MTRLGVQRCHTCRQAASRTATDQGETRRWPTGPLTTKKDGQVETAEETPGHRSADGHAVGGSRHARRARGLERLVEHILAGGVAGLFILGTTGEGPSLSYRLRQRADRSRVPSRSPAACRCWSASPIRPSSSRSSWPATPPTPAPRPSCWPRPTTSRRPARAARIRRAHRGRAAAAGVPLQHAQPHEAHLRARDGPPRDGAFRNVVGLKDSSADMIYFHHVRRLLAAAARLDAADRARRSCWPRRCSPAATAACAAGPISFRGCTSSCTRPPRRQTRSRIAVHARVMRIAETIYSVGNHRSAFIKGLKCARSCLGICDDSWPSRSSRFGRTIASRFAATWSTSASARRRTRSPARRRPSPRSRPRDVFGSGRARP